MAAPRPDEAAARVRDEARRALARWNGSVVVVAVSGGGDSVGLLRVLAELRADLSLTLSVAHLDHGVRAEAAAADAAFVARLAEELGLQLDLGRWTPSRASHFEASARDARYRWLEEIARGRGAAAVAVGHTRDDQAETVLHRILRGTGLKGLAGIPASRPLANGLTLIRPLLGVSHAEIRAYLGALGQDYRTDATNTDLSRTRARIRHDLLPRLAAEYNPRVADALVRLGRLAGASEHTLGRYLRTLERRATVSASAEAVELDRKVLRRHDIYTGAEILRLAWRRQHWPEMGMSAERWRRLAVFARCGTGRIDAGGGVELQATPATVLLVRFPAPPS